MHSYNLGFISDQDLFNHVLETGNKYRFVIDLKEFNKNLVDPIKFSFDAHVYGNGRYIFIKVVLQKTSFSQAGLFIQITMKVFTWPLTQSN